LNSQGIVLDKDVISVISESLPELNSIYGKLRLLKRSKCQRRKVSRAIFEWLRVKGVTKKSATGYGSR